MRCTVRMRLDDYEVVLYIKHSICRFSHFHLVHEKILHRNCDSLEVQFRCELYLIIEFYLAVPFNESFL